MFVQVGSRELSFLGVGAKVPTGNFAPRSENTGERKVLIPYTALNTKKSTRQRRKCTNSDAVTRQTQLLLSECQDLCIILYLIKYDNYYARKT